MIWISTLLLSWFFVLRGIYGQGSTKYPVRHDNIGPFDEKFYAGTRSQAIAVIYHKKVYPKWVNQPTICHGVFADFLKVVTTCSCVARYTGHVQQANTPWHHRNGYVVERMDPKDLSISILDDQFLKQGDGRPINQVRASKIELAAKCSNDFRANFAIITLESKPKGAKLAWFYTADWLLMKWAIQKIIMAAASGFARCEVLRWSDHGKPLEKDGQSRAEAQRDLFPGKAEITRDQFPGKVVRFDEFGHQRLLQAHQVDITTWVQCRTLVCPEYAPEDFKGQLEQDVLECFNTYNETRFCVEWDQMDSLCLLPEGTPIFCEHSDIRGVFGLLSNATLWCDKSFNFKNVMYGMDTIMHALYTILRIRNGPGYDSQAVSTKAAPNTRLKRVLLHLHTHPRRIGFYFVEK
ncbi:hypothetical protein GE061_007978 [Apolygus lucorum]|uniref:Peptidase S1 domain-containing protein n=1 Tax=Apolygus lucorum TaxID=248454 RepID=A0A8S9WQ16_APOLU|nr:hypothetical protein GE061_007978 [Apolygus lucorum]